MQRRNRRNGVASCSITPSVAVGSYALTGNFAGTAAFLASSATKRIDHITPPAHQLLNISTRARIGTGDNVVIGGFIVTGSQPKRVIIRGIGRLRSPGWEWPVRWPIPLWSSSPARACST